MLRNFRFDDYDNKGKEIQKISKKSKKKEENVTLENENYEERKNNIPIDDIKEYEDIEEEINDVQEEIDDLSSLKNQPFSVIPAKLPGPLNFIDEDMLLLIILIILFQSSRRDNSLILILLLLLLSK